MTTALAAPAREAIIRVESARAPKYLCAADVRRLIDACRNPRDRLLVQLGWETGGRISELLAVTRADVDLANRTVRLRTLKKPRDARRRAFEHFRVIPLRDGLAADLAEYIIHEMDGRSDRLFPISRTYAFELVRSAAQRAELLAQGLPVGPHTLRHSFAVHCLSSGVPINVVKDLLGHSSILTTMIYLRVVPIDFRNYLRRVEF
jgi:integrase/recombinase XerD